MVVTLGQQYNIGEKPTVTLYTYINHHVGTPKQKQTTYYTVLLDKEFQTKGRFKRVQIRFQISNMLLYVVLGTDSLLPLQSFIGHNCCIYGT